MSFASFRSLVAIAGGVILIVGLSAAVRLSSVRADDAKAGQVELAKVNHAEMLKTIAANKKAKYTIVDIWATWCTPCMENFPHVVDMHKKYAAKGLAVCSLSMDDLDDAPKALDFLKKQNATFTNFIGKDADEIFEKIEVQAIPAVLVFGPDGKLIKKYSMDDPDNQFTYDEVEADIKKMLDGAK